MEIVSKPDIRSPQEAGAYVKKIRSILRYIRACDGNMEEGSLRADCNVSVRKSGEEFGTRCEIKNLNSIRFIIQAIQSEAERQVDILEKNSLDPRRSSPSAKRARRALQAVIGSYPSQGQAVDYSLVKGVRE